MLKRLGRWLRPTTKGGVVRLLVLVLLLGVLAGAFWSLAIASGPRQASLDLTLEQLEDRVMRDPQSTQARLSVAIAYTVRGYNASAIQQYQEVLKLEENNQTALIGLGRLNLQQGKLDEALEPLLKVAELNKDNPFKKTLEQLEIVYYDIGVIYVRKNKFPEAVPYLRQALEINPVDADAWYMIGRAQQESGDLEGALASYKETVRFAPNFVEAYRGLAEVYSRQGKDGERKYATGMIHLASRSFDEAIRDLQDATKAVPDLGVAHQGLGLALEGKGRKTEALEAYQRALALDPTLILARLGSQRLTRP